MMELTESIAFVRRYNAWRRNDDESEMPHPKDIGQALDALCGHAERLQRELAAITGEEGELWELRKSNARMKDNLASLSHLHAKESEKWQASYEAERALPSNLLDVHAICDQRDNALEDLRREQALADRLAGALSVYWGDSRHLGHFMPEPANRKAEDALAAWKEARRE